MTDSAPAPDADPALADLPDEPPIERLIAVMAKLRDPDGGCPWDLEQSFETIAPYTIEEAYEVAEAITLGDMASLRDELGDLLLQVVYHAQMAREMRAEDGAFTFDDVARGICEKMIRRHPHVFAGASVEDVKAQTHAWEKQKAAERADKAEAENRTASVLDGVSSALPALMRSLKLQNRAVRAGFDWPGIDGVFDKIDEELGELRAEVTGSDADDPDRIEDEVGDLLFTVVNLARRLDVDPETALRRCNAKFERRFRFMEDGLAAEGTPIQSVGLSEMERHWKRAKDSEKR